MLAGFFQRFTSLAIWSTVCIFFSLFVSSGAVVLAGFILVILFGIIAVMLGPQFVAASWIIGSPTIFGFPNEILRPLPFVTMERLILVLLIVMVFLRYTFTRQKTRWLPVEVSMVVFLLYAMISLAMHTDLLMLSQDGWLWVQYLMPMVSFIISRRIPWTERGLKTLLGILTLTGVFIAVTGILQSRFGINVFTMNYQTITAGHTGRAYGTFSSAHTYVATLFIFLTISLLQFNLSKDAFIRTVLLIAMAIMAIGIVLGETRGPWIGAAIAFSIIFIKHPESRPFLILGGGIGFFLGMTYFFMMIEHLDSFINRVTSVGTLLGRAAVWATAVNMITDNPIFGVGFGATSFSLHKPEYITGIGPLSAQYAVYLGVPHNEYLHVTVLLGITGLVLFLMILVRLVKLMFFTFNANHNNALFRYLGLYAGAIIVALMFNSFFSDTYIQDYFWMLAYFLAGIAAGSLEKSLSHSDEKEKGGNIIGT